MKSIDEILDRSINPWILYSNWDQQILKDCNSYLIEDGQGWDRNMKVLPWYYHLKDFPNHIFFSFQYKKKTNYKLGIDGLLNRQKLIQSYIHRVRVGLKLSQKDINVFSTGEEKTPRRIHTHSILTVRNPTPEKIESILSTMHSLVPDEVEFPDIQRSENSQNTGSYTCKESGSLSEKEVFWTTGYWKFYRLTKKQIEIAAENI